MAEKMKPWIIPTIQLAVTVLVIFTTFIFSRGSELNTINSLVKNVDQCQRDIKIHEEKQDIDKDKILTALNNLNVSFAKLETELRLWREERYGK